MEKRGSSQNKFFYWFPRVVGIIFAMIVEIFILMTNGLTAKALVSSAFVALLIVSLILAWKWPLHGGIAYVSLGLLYFVTSVGTVSLSLSFAVAVPLVVAGFFFILDWEMST